jgi:hypothetical protein
MKDRTRLGVALAVLAAALALTAPAYADVGQPRTGSAKYDRDASVVEYGGTTYLFFARSQQSCNRLTTPVPALCPDNLDYDLYYKISSDGGKTFGPATLLDSNPGPVFFRGRTIAATATGDGVHVLWSNGANSIDGRVYHYFAPGGGTSFSPRQEVADIPDDVFNAEAVGDGQNVYAYTQETVPAGPGIYAYRFSATGPNLTLTGGPTKAADNKALPKAIRDVNGGFRMTMVDDSAYPTVDVYVDSSADGLNWPAPEQRVVSQTGVSNWDPNLVQKPNGQYYLYHAPDADQGLGSQRIALTMSNDFVKWTTPHEVSPGQKGGTKYWDYWPEGFVRGNQIVLFYTSEREVNEGQTRYPTGTGHIWTDPGFGGLDHLGPGA